MKKLIATLLTTTILLTSTAMILAENGRTSSVAGGAKEKFQTALQNREANIQQSMAEFNDLLKKIETKRAQIEVKKASFKTKQEEFQAFKDSLFTMKSQMLDLRSTANQLHAENAKLMGDVRNSLNSLSEKGIVLSPETKLALDSSTNQIKELTVIIKETKGQIQAILKDNKEFVKDRDYVSMEPAFEHIIAIEKLRNDSLTKINNLLQDMVKLLVAVV